MSLEDEIKELNTNIKELISILISKNNSETDRKKSGRLIPIGRWDSYHDWPPVAGLRSMVFNEKINGASIWIKRVGRRVLIDEDEFFKWAKNK